MRYSKQSKNFIKIKFKIEFAITLLFFISICTGASNNNANDVDNILGQGPRQISDINLLLPISQCQDCRKSVYNISATNGCYQWEVSHSNMVQIKPIYSEKYSECQNICQVQPVSTKPSKSIVWIQARDKNSGQVLRCETKLSEISKIEVVTHLRQFYVDDYEYLYIIGYDEEGNVFNSLEGLRFEWTIEKGNDIVKIVSMKEASHKVSEVKREMEFSKLHSDVLFLKGSKPGTATISVKINEPGYEHIPANQVTVTITEPFVIEPSNTVYLLPTTKFQFQLSKVTLKNHHMIKHPITLPSKQYQWNLYEESEDKGVIGEDGVFISKDKEGFVNIIVVDQVITNNTAESSVKIVQPSFLDIEIVDVTDTLNQQKSILKDDFNIPYSQQLDIKEWDNNWVLVQNHYYLIKVFIYDKDKNQIQLTENLKLLNQFDSDYFQVLRSNKIGSEYILKASKETINQKLTITSILDEIKSSLPGYKFNVDKSRLRSEKEVKITKPVSIEHPTDLILLPILNQVDSTMQGEIWHMKALGGTGFYQWSIKDKTIASISGKGIVQSQEIGKTEIVVIDSMNSKNQATINLEVTPVFQFSWLEDHLEIEKKNEIGILSIIALDRNGRKFTNCTALNVQFEVQGEGILVAEPTQHSYSNIEQFVQDHKDLMSLSQRFIDNPQAITLKDIGKQEPFSKLKESQILHNNFGICSQQRVSAIGEGLGRAKAFYVNQQTKTSSKILESNYVEIAAYNRLQTLKPSYNEFFSDLQSANQPLQEDNTISNLYESGNYNIAFGSSLNWVITGGTNFWKDIPEKYQVNTGSILLNQQEGGLDPDILDFKKDQETTNLFKYSIVCKAPSNRDKLSKPHHYRFNLSQQNTLSRNLLRPAIHKLSIDIHCEPPLTQRMYWAQSEKQISQIQLQNLPRFKMITSEKTHYVLVNSNHHLRSLLFDAQHHVFFNYSSIDNEINSSNEQMIKILPLNESYNQQVENNVYDKRRIEVSNITGTVYLNALVKGYYKGFLESLYYRYQSTESLRVPYQVNDRMRIEVVKNIDIQPKYKSLYLSSKGNSFEFQILHGSGHFIVNLNNTNIAEMHQRENRVTIYPKQEGSLEIRVEDAEIPNSISAVAELLISDIASLELDSPGSLIEQGSSMDLYVTAYDSYGRQFAEDQYKQMEFYIDIENIGVKRTKELVAKADTTDNRKFIAIGNEPGSYQVNAFTYKFRQQVQYYSSNYQGERQRLISDMIKIEVFPLLEIQPSNLLLTPSMKYTLQIVGGPSRSATNQNLGQVEIKFDVEDKSISSVDVFREVTAHQVGDTNLYYEVIQLKQVKSGQERRSIVSKKTIPIRVRLVTDIEIPYNDQRVVYSGGLIKLIGILKYNQETFTHGIAPISYNWNCSNPNILQLQQPSKSDSSVNIGVSSTMTMVSKNLRNNEQNNNNAIFFSSFNTSSIYGLANQQGETLVTLSLAIEYPQKYNYDKNWFKTSIIMRTNEKLKIEVPEFINQPDKQTHLYLMPPNTYSRIETNKQTRLRLGISLQSVYDYQSGSYKMTETTSPMLKLINNEGIQTLDKYGKVTVIIEEDQAFSDQVVMLNVLITDIFTIATKDIYQALSFPLGSTMTLPIKFQNEHGHQFANHLQGVDVGIQLSHPRVINAALDHFNQTITLQAQGSGECNVVIYQLSHPHIFDVFKVRVSSVVKPPSPVNLHLGGQVTFKIMDASQYGQSTDGAIWSSINPSVIDINQKTGEARALSEGKADIHLSNHISAASILHVSKVKHAELDERSRKNLIINADEPNQDLRVRIKLFLQDQIDELTPTVQYDGVTLIKQNVGLICESDNPQYVQAKGEVNEIEGFYCSIKVAKKSQDTNVPRQSLIQVYVSSQDPRYPSDTQKVLYSEKVLQFEVNLISKIKVESRYRKGIQLNNQQRSLNFKVYSNTPIQSYIENVEEEDKSYELVKHRVTSESDKSNEYTISLTVPREITHDFKSTLVLSHPITGEKVSIPINFSGKESIDTSRYYKYEEEEEEDQESIFSKISSFFKPNKEREQEGSRERHDIGEETQRKKRKEGQGIMGYFILFVLIMMIVAFFAISVFRVDPAQFKRVFERRPAQYQRRPQAPQRAIIREPLQRNIFQAAPNLSFFKSPGQSYQSQNAGQRGSVQAPKRDINLGSFNYTNESDRNRYSSLYETSPQRKTLS